MNDKKMWLLLGLGVSIMVSIFIIIGIGISDREKQNQLDKIQETAFCLANGYEGRGPQGLEFRLDAKRFIFCYGDGKLEIIEYKEVWGKD